MIDLRNQDAITIDGLLEFHKAHGNDVSVLITPQHMAYVHSQLKYAANSIRTYDQGQHRIINLSDTEPRP